MDAFRFGWRRFYILRVTAIIALFLLLFVANSRALLAADTGSSTATEVNEPTNSADASAVGQMGAPHFPFESPQIGPLIKRYYPNEVDRRTTAFIPTSPAQLSDLTPIIMPSGEARWIRVDLSEQVAVAYEGVAPVRAFVISSGLPGTPTVTGRFRIRIKVPTQTMSGGSGALYYFLPNVQWVQYFYEEYGFHGTYWHNDFGQPRSHGCINMTNADAKWLFDWAGPVWDGSDWQKVTNSAESTLVIVHD